MAPLLRVSNIASSTMSDENDRFYITVQLPGCTVVWLYSFGWTVLSHWTVTDEVKNQCILCVCYIWNFTDGFNIFLYFITGWGCGSVYGDNNWNVEVTFH